MSKIIDEVGKKYGKLTVLERADNSASGKARWRCQCECGEECISTGTHLRSGRATSCGCGRVETNKKNMTKSEVGNTYGKLTVIKQAESNANYSGAFWECECQCGTKTVVYGALLRSGHSQSCGCLRSRGEYEIANLLIENGYSFIKEKTFNDLVGPGGGKLRFDFAIYKNKKLSHLIEFDGEQHFREMGFSRNKKRS